MLCPEAQLRVRCSGFQDEGAEYAANPMLHNWAAVLFRQMGWITLICASALPLLELSVSEPLTDGSAQSGPHRWSAGRLRVIEAGQLTWEGAAAVRLRGQSTAALPQKSFSLELRDSLGEDLKVSLLGMPDEADWILYAPYRDPTLIRNVLVYEIARELWGADGAVRTRFCTVNLSGPPAESESPRFWGLYVLMEKIERGPERVCITKLGKRDLTAPSISGGYLFKRDTAPVGTVFTTPYGQHLEIIEPDEPQPGQTEWLQAWINQAETALPRSKMPWSAAADVHAGRRSTGSLVNAGPAVWSTHE